MSDYLFLLSISPVQDFISQARKTNDLYVGSRILSDSIKYVITKLQQSNDFKLIFPNLINDSLPNRFVCKLKGADEETVQKFGAEAEKAFNEKIKEIIWNTIELSKKGTFNSRITNQVLDFFSLNWCAVEIKTDYQSAYKELEKLHASIKNVRRFKQLGDGSGEQGRKCSICGERNAYFFKTKRRKSLNYLSQDAIEIDSAQIDDNEGLCLVELTKRFYNVNTNTFPSTAELAIMDQIDKEDINLLNTKNINIQLLYNEETDKKNLSWSEKVPDEKTLNSTLSKVLKNNNLKISQLAKYFATIIFDGDKMGKLLSGSNLKEPNKLEEFHQVLTKCLSVNAQNAKEIVNKHGATVYAGGDDFLGFSTISNLFSILKALDQTFKQNVQNKLADYLVNPREVTISLGVMIAHYKTPLQSVLKMAREMESIAKNKGGRNAIALAIKNHSGSIVTSYWNWSEDYKNLNSIENILQNLTKKNFSTNFIYKLIEEFQYLDYIRNQSYDRQFHTELKRLVINSSLIIKIAGESDKEFILRKQNLIEQCVSDCSEIYTNAGDDKKLFFDLLKIIAFLAKELGGVK